MISNRYDPSAYGHVYLVTNTINGKRYVGQTTGDPAARWTQGHVRAARTQRSIRMPVVLAIRKYGKNAFVLEILSRASSQYELDCQELTAAREYDTFTPRGYNIRAGTGVGSMSPKQRERMSENFPEELKQRFRENYSGRRWSDLAYQRSAAANQATYTIYDPNGELVVITNFKKFVRDKESLDSGLLQSTARGRRWRHRGWYIALNQNWPEASALGDYKFCCPGCATEWTSLSQRHANVHTVSCHRKIAMLHAARDLGNISEHYLLQQLQLLSLPHVMGRSRAARNRNYVVISPDGETFTVDNMRRFSRIRGLNPGKMSLLVNKRVTQHKGWTVSDIGVGCSYGNEVP